ncbi:MAG: hypothetical protein AB9866_08620 [Syntrophobacteraceae bacterium]
MRRTLIAACFIFLCSSMLPLHCFAGSITLKPNSEGEWAIQDSKEQPLGVLRRAEDESFSIQLKDGQFLGLITKTGELQMPRRHPLLKPDEARLYLDVLDALPGLKKKP